MKTAPRKPAKTASAKPAKRVAASALRGTPLVDNVAMTREMFEYFKKHRDQGHELLMQTGIYTKAGKLTKAYGG